MYNNSSSLEQTAQDFIIDLIRENQQLKEQMMNLHERLQKLAIRYDDLLELNIHTASYAKTQSSDSLAQINFMLQSMIPPPEYRTECDSYIDVETDDFLTVYEDTARLASELFPDEPYFQPYQTE